MINLFLTSLPIWNPMKKPESQWFSYVVKGYKIGKLARKKLNKKLKHYLNGIGNYKYYWMHILNGNKHYKSSDFTTQEFSMFLFYF